MPLQQHSGSMTAVSAAVSTGSGIGIWLPQALLTPGQQHGITAQLTCCTPAGGLTTTCCRHGMCRMPSSLPPATGSCSGALCGWY